MDQRTPTKEVHVLSPTTLLWQYYLLSCVLVMVNLSSYFSTLNSPSPMAMVFYGIAWFVYAMAYLLPAVFLLLIVRGLGQWIGRVFRIGGTGTVARGAWYGLAVLAFSSVQMILYTDKTIYKMFGFHLNGFVWNLLITPGVSSMGGRSTRRPPC
jgi:membrane-anchored protein YejM (alkaline phosphatase superfamily)